jgi:hypothetical protein
LVPCCLDLPCKSSWILNKFSLKIKLNHSWNFAGIGIFLWCCWKDLDEQDLMEFIWKDLDSECGRYWFWSDFYCWKFK